MRMFYFGEVEKRCGKWGWWRGFADKDVQPHFVSYGYITTKKEAIERRAADINEVLSRGDGVRLYR